jgi:hypothetical protein
MDISHSKDWTGKLKLYPYLLPYLNLSNKIDKFQPSLREESPIGNTTKSFDVRRNNDSPRIINSVENNEIDMSIITVIESNQNELDLDNTFSSIENTTNLSEKKPKSPVTPKLKKRKQPKHRKIRRKDADTQTLTTNKFAYFETISPILLRNNAEIPEYYDTDHIPVRNNNENSIGDSLTINNTTYNTLNHFSNTLNNHQNMLALLNENKIYFQTQETIDFITQSINKINLNLNEIESYSSVLTSPVVKFLIFDPNLIQIQQEKRDKNNETYQNNLLNTFTSFEFHILQHQIINNINQKSNKNYDQHQQ